MREWNPTCAAEIRAWYASVIWWSLSKGLSFEQFIKVTIDPHRARKWFPSVTRWQQLKRFLKVSDPLKDPHHCHDRIYRLRELFDFFISACKANYWPDVNVALDEAIKKFKGRCIFKQYIKNKPVRWGIKIFCVCCSATAYLWNAAFYVGRRKDEDCTPSAQDYSVTTETVLKLMEPLQGKNHRVHMDNYYTSIPLFRELEKLCIWSTGTVRVNRKGLDKEIAIKKSEQSKLKKTPGYCRFSSDGALTFCAWFDKRPVHVLSNTYAPLPANNSDESIVKRWYDAKKNEEGQTQYGKIQRDIFIPMINIVLFYNLYMGAVDLFDQYRSYIKLELRSGKFWHPMMWFIFESALVNSWVLYKCTREKAGLPLQYTHLEFRISIALALAAEWEDMGCISRSGNIHSPHSEFTKLTAKRARRTLLTREEPADKYTAVNKHLDAMEKIPLREDSKAKKRQLLCQCCKTARTTFWCRTCAVPLCRYQCFITYHSEAKKPKTEP